MKYIYLVMQKHQITDGVPVMAFESLDDAEKFCETAPFDVYARILPQVEKVEEEQCQDKE